MNDGDKHDDGPCAGLPMIEEIPDFKSSIPPELTDKLDAKYRALFDAISKIEKHVEWNTGHVVPNNRAIHRLCRRLDKIERRQAMWSAKYGWVLWVGTTIAGAVVLKLASAILDMIWK